MFKVDMLSTVITVYIDMNLMPWVVTMAAGPTVYPISEQLNGKCTGGLSKLKC
jgi:hypothetical protein